LSLERALPKLSAPRLVVYGFIKDHETRNVAPSHWLQALAKFSKRSHVYLPFVSLDENSKLLRHPPQRYMRLPFDESSALVAIIEKASMNLLTHGRTLYQREISEKLILEMQRVSELYGAKLLVALLDPELENYLSFLKRHNISYANCSFHSTDDMKVKGEGHPNAKMHTLWAKCIIEAIVLNLSVHSRREHR
jgi:hypothetical protein